MKNRILYLECGTQHVPIDGEEGDGRPSTVRKRALSPGTSRSTSRVPCELHLEARRACPRNPAHRFRAPDNGSASLGLSLPVHKMGGLV